MRLTFQQDQQAVNCAIFKFLFHGFTFILTSNLFGQTLESEVASTRES